MQKRIIGKASEDRPLLGDWLDVEQLAQVEVSSEDSAHTIEAALLPNQGLGWRAEGAGRQLLRLLFNRPVNLRRILLEFEEGSTARTQEFVLRYAQDAAAPPREIVRQQWNFSPPGTTTEVEDLQVNLTGVTVLELEIVPDISGGTAVASLRNFRVG